MNHGDATHVRCGDKSGEISYHPTAKGNHGGVTSEAAFYQVISDPSPASPRLAGFASRNSQNIFRFDLHRRGGQFSIQRTDVRVGDDGISVSGCDIPRKCAKSGERARLDFNGITETGSRLRCQWVPLPGERNPFTGENAETAETTGTTGTTETTETALLTAEYAEGAEDTGNALLTAELIEIPIRGASMTARRSSNKSFICFAAFSVSSACSAFSVVNERVSAISAVRKRMPPAAPAPITRLLLRRPTACWRRARV